MPQHKSLALPPAGLATLEPAQLPAPARVVALAAPESFAHPLVVQSLAARAGRGERLGVLVGHNRFEVYALAGLARAQGLDPRPLLARIELSRAFTCHQLHRRILTLDGRPPRRWSALYVLGLLDTFYDEDVKQPEAARLLSESLAQLKKLAAQGLPVLITVSAPREPGREHFVGRVARAADVYREPAVLAGGLEGISPALSPLPLFPTPVPGRERQERMW